MSLVAKALTSYRLVDQLDTVPKRKFVPPPAASPFKNFDFMADEEIVPKCLHDVEVGRETHRRASWKDSADDISTTRQEFAAKIELDVMMTKDPQDGLSVLDVSPAQRAYYGDPIEESFAALKYALGPVHPSIDWIKNRGIMTAPIASEFARMKWIEENMASIEDAGVPLSQPSSSRRERDRGGSGGEEEEVEEHQSLVCVQSGRSPSTRPFLETIVPPPTTNINQYVPTTNTKQRMLSMYADKRAAPSKPAAAL